MIGSEELKRLEHLNRVLAPVIRRLSRASVALCNVQGSQLPKHAGSSVLLRIENRQYLITASHVIDAAMEGRTLAAIIGKDFIDVGSRRRWRTKAGLDGTEDRTDLAIIELGSLHGEMASAVTSLELSDIDPFGTSDERERSTAFLGIGYPRSKQPRSLEGIRYKSLVYSFVSHREGIWSGNQIGADALRHIAIGYDKLGFAGDEETSQMPKPEGCSGGGLWRIPNATTSNDPQAKLIGIMIEYRSKPNNLILASRVWDLLGGLRGVHPANRDAIDALYPKIEERVLEFLE